ncbi:EamA domain-containing membrane protein RarD [Tamilnaduibacter salinus]|uniref:EamA domain-containing membrane protein RarD n=1 Tax=Tamilnaduibacter salinus TaxID=1484056 RepID=A0A2U1D058_9GAMM|nr:DMT family transporter [Tamilnaduibacter salinus]PVY78420.1 EamA domain-containing membrane protein RarD [Tamilnaduibacter salinus]
MTGLLTAQGARGLFAALFAVLLWSIAPLLVEWAAALPPLKLTAISLFAGAMATIPMSRKARPVEKPRLSRTWQLVIHLLLPLLVLGAVSFYLMGLGKAPTAKAALVTYTWPVLFVLLSDLVLRKRLSLTVLAGTTIAFSGTALVLGPQSFNGELSAHGVGYALALGSGLCWALYSMISQLAPVSITPVLPALFLTAGAGAAGADGLSGGSIASVSILAVTAGVVLGLGPYGLAMAAWNLALRVGSTAVVGPLAYLVPVLAAVFMVLAGVSAPDWRLPLAGVLVVTGCFVASSGRTPQGRALPAKSTTARSQ